MDVERIEAGLTQAFKQHPAVKQQLDSLTEQVVTGQVPASTAARLLLGAAAVKPAV